jgi:hypothetical protein
MARGKSTAAPIPGVPWWLILASHAAIHAGAVGLILPVQYALFEGLAHAATDHAKCKGWLGKGELSFVLDQAIHVALKVAYVWIHD